MCKWHLNSICWLGSWLNKLFHCINSTISKRFISDLKSVEIDFCFIQDKKHFSIHITWNEYLSFGKPKRATRCFEQLFTEFCETFCKTFITFILHIVETVWILNTGAKSIYLGSDESAFFNILFSICFSCMNIENSPPKTLKHKHLYSSWLSWANIFHFSIFYAASGQPMVAITRLKVFEVLLTISINDMDSMDVSRENKNTIKTSKWLR